MAGQLMLMGWEIDFRSTHRVARRETVGAGGRNLSVVPIVYAFDGRKILTCAWG